MTRPDSRREHLKQSLGLDDRDVDRLFAIEDALDVTVSFRTHGVSGTVVRLETSAPEKASALRHLTRALDVESEMGESPDGGA